jgi:predicted Zn-dependent protease
MRDPDVSFCFQTSSLIYFIRKIYFMYRYTTFLFIVLAIISGCTRNPVSNRSQIKLLPESELQTMATGEYKQFLLQNKIVTGQTSRDAEMVQRVGMRITKAVTDYYTSKGLASKLSGYNWEITLVDNKEANAWCMPGGKIVVYTGLLPITQNEAALAVVLGHEVTHAVFGHGNERMTQGLLQQAGGVALSVAVANKPQETRNIFLGAYGAGTGLGVLLPFSRKHEYEADHYGLWWAAMAGYDPREAISLWQRMEKAATVKSPEFLSTHPSEGNRIEQLQKYMPEALGYYKATGK